MKTKRAKLSQIIPVTSRQGIKRKTKKAYPQGPQQDELNGTNDVMNPLGRFVDPMKIDLILALIFDLCSISTLKNCRLVCKRWRDVSLRTWRNRAVLFPSKNTEGLNNFKQYLKLLQYKRDPFQLKWYSFKVFRIETTLTEYLKDAANPVSDIAQHVIICDVGSRPRFSMEFLSKFKSLETLELENCYWSCNRDGPYHSSNLKRLRISRNTNRGNLDQYVDWEFILNCFPKLEALAIEYSGTKDNIDDIKKVLTFILFIRNSKGGTIMPLKELNVTHIPDNPSVHENEDIIDAIIQCRFPLERLTFHLIWDVKDLEKEVFPLHRLLDSCKDRLQYLSMSFNFEVDDVAIVLLSQRSELRKKEGFTIRMCALEEIHLRNGIWGFYILGDLEFPNLRKLVVDTNKTCESIESCGQYQLPFPKEKICPKLDKFEFLDTHAMPGPNTIKAFAKMIPNLGNLTMPLDKYTFLIVCKRLKGLRRLHVLAAEHRYLVIDDEYFTGVPVGSTPGDNRSPNITDLRQLTELKIDSAKDWQDKRFTDHSAIYGLLQLPLLYSLDIVFTEITDDVKTKLEEHVKGQVNIQVKPKFEPDYYCTVDFEKEENRIKWK